MHKRSRRFQSILEKIDKKKTYSTLEALKILQSVSNNN